MRDYYTRYPRAVLWLVPGGELILPGGRVEVEPFYLSTLPVTNEQYEAFDPAFERDARCPRDRDPAVGLSWEAAAAYCRWYAEVARKPIRLPSEAEWEYACRGGTEGPSFWPDDPDGADRFTWNAANTPPGPLPDLDAKTSNPFGLYAMLGGVWEWLAPQDPNDPTRTLRGGSVEQSPDHLTPTLSREEAPDRPTSLAGFRIARSFR